MRRRNDVGAKGSQRVGRERGRDVTVGQQHALSEAKAKDSLESWVEGNVRAVGHLTKLVPRMSQHVARRSEAEAQQNVIESTQTRSPERI
jgi:hypothetical protein